MKNQQVKSRCLLLNADYTPLRIIDWTKAIVWSIKYNDNLNFGIKIIKYYDDEFINGTNNQKFLLPCIAKTLNYYSVYNRRINFSRKNLFIRDNYTCQYCGKNFTNNYLTYDHIIPKSRFSKNERHKSTTWTNIVTACKICNHKKGNKTPQEANMVLIRQPSRPTYSLKYLPLYNEHNIINNRRICEHWKEFIV